MNRQGVREFHHAAATLRKCLSTLSGFRRVVGLGAAGGDIKPRYNIASCQAGMVRQGGHVYIAMC
jgi:hypothetical protein